MELSGKDWIILRLIMAAAKNPQGFNDLEVVRSTHYLNNKYGKDVVLKSIDQLKKEKAQ